MKKSFAERYLDFLLRRQLAIVAFAIGITILSLFFLSRVRVYTNFFNLYPPRHPYIQLYNEYRDMFGSANVMVVALEVTEGTIFNVETIGKIDFITKFLGETPGVNPAQVISLTHPRLKVPQAGSGGVEIWPVIYPGLPTNQVEVDRIRDRVYRGEDIRGFYVSPDDTAAAVFAGFWEEGTDLDALFSRMQELKRLVEDDNHKTYIVGYPMLFAWVVQYLPLALVVLAATAGSIILLLWFYFRTWAGVWVPFLSGTLSGVWALGFAGMLGFDIDPLAIVVFLLITARALSHSVQSMERYHSEFFRLRDRKAAIIASYKALFPPATVSIAGDGLATLTLVTSMIPLIQNLAIISSFWILSIALSVVTLHPILLSCMKEPRHDPQTGKRFSDRVYNTINRGAVRLAQGSLRYVVVAGIFLSLIGGLYFGHFLRVGNTTAGRALLYEEHPYNRAFDLVNSKFVGSSQLVVIAEGKKEGAIENAQVLNSLQQFQKYMETHTESSGSITVTNLMKRLFRLFHEGEPRWSLLPMDERGLAQVFFILQSGTAKGELDRFFDVDHTNATVTVFYREYSNEAIKETIARARRFIEEHPVEGIDFRLAGGLIGILAAVHEAVEWSYTFNLYLVMTTVFILSFLTYRSVVGALIVMIPSIVAQPLTEAMMYLCSIDMNINSLPVAAIGIGIGIDYGYYVLSRIVEELEHGDDCNFDQANERALMSTGRAILFTGTTLTVSVIFWLWFPMKFQAEMALLLAMVLGFHVIGAIVFIPACVSLMRPRFARALAEGRLASAGMAQTEGESAT